MSYTIYFADKSLSFVNREDNSLINDNLAPNITHRTPSSPSTLLLEEAQGEMIKVTKIVALFEKYNNIVVKCCATDNTIALFTSQFKEVTAAGGLVVNPRNELLMINRFDRWDLPKGHHEEGETIEECSMREVEEESGVHPLELHDKVGVTLHAYEKKGVWELKTTHWWAMTSPQTSQPTPQSEEGITAAEWIPLNRVEEITQNSFPTIQNILRKAKIYNP